MSACRLLTAVARAAAAIAFAGACGGSTPAQPVVASPPACPDPPPVAGRQVSFRDDIRISNRGGQCRDYGGAVVEVSRPGRLDARVRWTDEAADLSIEVFGGPFGSGRLGIAQRAGSALCADVFADVEPGRVFVYVCHTPASRYPVSFTGPHAGFELTVYYP